MGQVKYALVVAKDSYLPRVIDHNTKRLTGLYLWRKIFEGETLSLSQVDECVLDYYDVLHVNLCAGNTQLPSKLRKLIRDGSDTKIICNMDYAVELFPGNFSKPDFSLDKVVKGICDSDMVFCQEQTQITFLEHWSERDIKMIPHPVDVDFIRTYRRMKWDRENSIATNYHRYRNDSMFQGAILDHEWGDGWKTKLFGYQKMSKGELNYGIFDEIHPVTSFERYLDELSKSRIAYDCHFMHALGRCQAEYAALEIPCVGPVNVWRQKTLFTSLTVDPWDMRQTRVMIKHLIKDKDYYNEAVNYASQEVEQYNLKNSERRMREALEEIGVG